MKLCLASLNNDEKIENHILLLKSAAALYKISVILILSLFYNNHIKSPKSCPNSYSKQHFHKKMKDQLL